MNQDELIEKCRLTDKELDELSFNDDISIPSTYDPLLNEWQTPIFDDLLDAQLRKAIPIIEAEARKAERERIADWLEQQGAVWVDKNYAIIKAIREGKL